MAVGPDGFVYVVIDSSASSEVRRYNEATGTDLGAFAALGQFSNDLAFGPNGDLFVTSAATDDVRRFDSNTGSFVEVFANVGADATGIAFGSDGRLYVGRRETGEVVRFDGMTGQFIDVFVEAGVIDRTSDIAFGPDGDLYVSSRSDVDAARDGVFRFSGASGEPLSAITTREDGMGLRNPAGIAFGPDGMLYVAGFSSGNVQRFNPATGSFLGDFAGVDRATGLLFLPSEVVPEPNALCLLILGFVLLRVQRQASE